jgi:uncharacterized membrane protein YecN with MAPEG domain
MTPAEEVDAIRQEVLAALHRSTSHGLREARMRGRLEGMYLTTAILVVIILAGRWVWPWIVGP